MYDSEDKVGKYAGLGGIVIVLLVLVYLFTPIPELLMMVDYKTYWPVVLIFTCGATIVPISIYLALKD